MERELLRAKGLLGEAEKPPEEDKPAGSLPAVPKAGSYVPPSVRNRSAAGGGSAPEDTGQRQRRDENSLRVTNLSEDTTEADLQELFRPFGPISRVFLALDRTTGESRGFAFVNYHYRCGCLAWDTTGWGQGLGRDEAGACKTLSLQLGGFVGQAWLSY
jgi:translation initiation factor 3 subunit G